MPRMAFIGVRISWLMLARNSLLAWFAASAACRASRSASACRRAVMSRAMPTVPATRPSPPCSAVLMVSTRVLLPSALTWCSSIRLDAVRRHHFSVVEKIGPGEFRRVKLEIGLADHLARLGKALAGGEGPVDGDEVAARVLHPCEVRDVVQDRRHACIGVPELHGVLPQPLAHRVEGVHQLVEFIALARRAPQSQRRGLCIRA